MEMLKVSNEETVALKSGLDGKTGYLCYEDSLGLEKFVDPRISKRDLHIVYRSKPSNEKNNHRPYH